VFSYCIEKKGDNINEIIDELVELNKAVKAPVSHIGSTVSQIRAAAHASAKAFKAFYNRVDLNCKAGFGFIKSFTSKLNGDLVGVKAAINSAHARIKKNTAAVADFAKKLAANKAELRNSHKRHAIESRNFRHRLLEAGAKLTTLRHIRNIIVDELLNGKAPASLIQVNTISTQLKQLKTLVEKDNDTMFSSVVSALLELVSEKNLNDQVILRKFLASLNKLAHKIRAWRRSAIADHKKIRKLNRASNAAKLKSIRALGNLLVEARSEVVGATRAIDELNNAIFIINKALARKQKENKHWERICDDQKRVAKIFTTAYTNLKNKVKKVGAALLNLQ
jgi:hypothetical protein